MRRRKILSILAAVVLGVGTLSVSVAADKEQKVTLTISGMT
jgi:hypothetical protein